MAIQLESVLGPWATGTGPLYDQLALAILRRIESGALPIGTRLPPERVLAKALAVSRTTVVNAYTRLDELGWLERRQGAGTWVARRHQQQVGDTDGPGRPARDFAPLRVLRATTEVNPGVIDLATAGFKDALGIEDALRAIGTADLDANAELGGYLPLGLPILREAIANYLTARGVPTVSAEVVVTTGVQQAATVLFDALAGDGRPVVVRTPAWNGTLDLLERMRLVTVAVADDAGDDPLAALRAKARDGHPALAWVTSGFGNPTGTALPAAEAAGLARIAADTGVPLIEDATLADFALGDRRGHLVAEFSGDGPVITVGSLSKLLSPTLRVGWIRAPRPWIGRIGRYKTLLDNGASLLPQMVAASLLEQRESLVANRIAQVTAAYESFTEAAGSTLEDWTWQRPDGGFALWVRLPDCSGTDFTQTAARFSVEIVPGSVFYLNRPGSTAIRLSLTRTAAETADAAGRLGRAWRARRS